MFLRTSKAVYIFHGLLEYYYTISDCLITLKQLDTNQVYTALVLFSKQ